ncbi:hypothetical protein JXA80_06370 [bacterium]|nr:hypothetical protein [candidate division CSSED10-310 bacterium]
MNSSVLHDPEWNYPDKAPKIGVEPIDPGPDPCRVHMAGDPFHFGMFVPNDQFAVCDYDLPDENLTQITRGITRGPVAFNGRVCTEIICREFEPEGKTIQYVRRLVAAGHRFGHILLITLRRPGGMGSVEITDLEFPLVIEPRGRWNVFRCSGPIHSGNTQLDVHRITGPVQVFVGKDCYRCLRWLRPRTSGLGYREAEELMVDIETGLTVLVRSYVGSGYPDIEQFQRSPKLELAGEIFYLRYIRRVLRSTQT